MGVFQLFGARTRAAPQKSKPMDATLFHNNLALFNIPMWLGWKSVQTTTISLSVASCVPYEIVSTLKLNHKMVVLIFQQINQAKPPVTVARMKGCHDY